MSAPALVDFRLGLGGVNLSTLTFLQAETYIDQFNRMIGEVDHRDMIKISITHLPITVDGGFHWLLRTLAYVLTIQLYPLGAIIILYDGFVTPVAVPIDFDVTSQLVT